MHVRSKDAQLRCIKNKLLIFIIIIIIIIILFYQANSTMLSILYPDG